MKRFLLPLGVFLGLLLLLAVGLRLNPREIPSPFIGKPAPAFRLEQLHAAGKTISAADMAGQVWMLNVWASWCSSCRVEHPALLKFARTNAIPVLGLNYKDTREEGMKWLEEQGNPYLVSAFDKEGRVGIDYGVYGVPETFVIDKKGVIRMKFTGPLTDDTIRGKLLPLIEELKNA
ncbi:DsbE family thiol:disulfide interchange protein [Noviherbaspirillum galbum]|uniref:DsbE family thiol:disulfide interchange protein n=1 Tax=Noviherbaspirillum galbum TaxID=2709383 RepID=A0A6B3SLA5_9BURK|nr:DsbE family thiol:disulfide interchange protein [Noviherbaspirillum galbum]NEX61581.1 DsbE family thiol:disulfide interchange protein [Noviherbaspirillum galbum]